MKLLQFLWGNKVRICFLDRGRKQEWQAQKAVILSGKRLSCYQLPQQLNQNQLFLICSLKYCQYIQDYSTRHALLHPLQRRSFVSDSFCFDKVEVTQRQESRGNYSQNLQAAQHFSPYFFPLFQEMQQQREVLFQLLTQLLVCSYTECCGLLVCSFPSSPLPSSYVVSFGKRKHFNWAELWDVTKCKACGAFCMFMFLLQTCTMPAVQNVPFFLPKAGQETAPCLPMLGHANPCL